MHGARSRARSQGDDGRLTLAGMSEEAARAVLVTRLEEHDRRLADGSESFEEIREHLSEAAKSTNDALRQLVEHLGKELRRLENEARAAAASANSATPAIPAATAPRPAKVPWLTVVGMAGSLLIVIVTLVWTASRYPERSEYQTVERRLADIERVTEKNAAVTEQRLRQIEGKSWP